MKQASLLGYQNPNLSCYACYCQVCSKAKSGAGQVLLMNDKNALLKIHLYKLRINQYIVVLQLIKISIKYLKFSFTKKILSGSKQTNKLYF